MLWIESHTVLLRHRKTVGLARALRLRPAYVLGHLHALWHAALEQREDGDLSSWSDEIIADLSDFPGDAPQYVRLLQEHGWLDGKLLHDWLDYAGRYLVTKYSAKNRLRLVEIWALHGRTYGRACGEPRESKGRVKGDQKESERRALPDLTRPNLTKPTKDPPNPPAGGREGGECVTAKGVEIPPPLRTPEFLAAWADWEAHLREKRVRTTSKADRGQLARCEAWGADDAAENIRNSIAGNYQGIYPPKGSNGSGGGHETPDQFAARLARAAGGEP